MGDIYKGLTIRIGAETSELKKALRASNTAINDTQKQLRKLAQAAKLEPNNILAINQQFDLMGDKARALTGKLGDMRAELAFMKQRLQEVKGKEVFDELAFSAKDAAHNAAKAKQEYAEICDTIRRFKNAVSSAAGEDEKIWNSIEEGSEAAKAKILELSGSLEKVAQYEKLVALYFEKMKKYDLADLINDVKNYETKVIAAEAETREWYKTLARMVTQNPTATMTVGFRKLRSEMNAMEAAAKELAADVQMLDRALDLDPENIDAARLKMASMQEQTRLNIREIDNLNQQIAQLKAEGADKIAGKFVDIRLKVQQAEAKVASLNQELDETEEALKKADGAELERLEKHASEVRTELAKANVELDEFAAGLKYVDTRSSLANLTSQTNKLITDMKTANAQAAVLKGSLQQLGWAMYSTATPVASMFAYTAISAADEVDAAYRDMRKTVAGTEEQFESMKQAALDYSRTHVTDAATLLEIEAMGGQLGVATDKLEGFATTVSNLEIATNLEADKAAEQLGQLAGILNDMGEDDFDNFGDALVRLGNNNATLEDKIMDVMLRIASMGTITGFSATELLAWSTAVAATGQGAEAAGTAISKTMSDIESAVASGGDKLAGFASVAGMTSSEFAQAWNETPSDALKAFIEGLNRIEEEGGSADGTLEGLKITSVRQKQAIEGLMQTIGGLNDNLEMSDDAWNGMTDEWGAAGDAAREAAAKAEGFSGAIQLLRNNVDVLGVEMGESMTPAILALTDLVSWATQAYSDLGEAGKAGVNFGVLLAAGLGPAAIAINSVKNVLGDLMKSKALKGMAWSKAVKSSKDYTEALRAAADMTLAGSSAAKELSDDYDEMNKKGRLAAAGTGILKDALIGLGVAAAVAGVMALVHVLKEAYEHSVDLRDATTGLTQAVSGWSGIAATNGLDAYGDFAFQAALSVEELTKRQAELARTIKERHNATETDAKMLGQYGDVIEELAGKSGITDEQLAKLKIAVDEVNAACGTNYAVEKEGEAYVIMADGAEVAKDAIYDLIAAKQAELRAGAYESTYKELYAQEAEAVKTLAQAKRDQSIAQGEYDLAVKNGIGYLGTYEQNLAAANARLEEAQRDYDAVTGAMSAAEEQHTLLTAATYEDADAMTKWMASQDLARAILSENGQSVYDFMGALETLGVSQEQLSELSEDELNALVSAYDGTMHSLVEILEGYGVDLNDAAVKVAKEMVDVSLTEFGEGADKAAPKGYDFGAGFASGMGDSSNLVWNAAQQLVFDGLNAIQAAQNSHSPAKKTMPFGEDFVDGYVVGIEDETPEAVDAAESLVDDTLDMLATSESGTWVHGYHAAINYADGLASGAGAVKDAAGSLASSAADEMDAFIDDLAAQYKKAQLVAKEGDKLLTEIMWGSIYPATMKYEYKTPQTEDVYASMKVLEAAGYDLDEYIEKHAELSEKMKSGDVSDSVKAEYEKIMALSGQLTASTDKMKEWHGLYTVKDDLITGMDTAEDWSDSLVSLFGKTGVVYSKEFVDAMTSGGEEYQSALRKMAGMTSSQVQEMVDSFDDLALAQREQEINARSLWVNSLPNAMVNSKEAMLDFRETCLDVKEAIYSDKGLKRAFELTGTEVVNLALDLESLDVTMADFASMAQGYASQVANGFQAMTTYNQTGLYEWERNLKANIVSAQQWADNVNAVFDSIDPSIDSEAFRQAVLNEGFDVWGQVMADMATMPPERIGEYVALYNEALTTGMMSAYETMDAIAPGDELLQATIEGIAGLTPELEGQAKDAALKGAGAALATQPEWYSTGVNLAGGIASGIQSQIGAIAAAAAATVRAAIEAAKAEAEIHSPSDRTHDEIGVMWGLGVAGGIDDSVRDIRIASVKAVNAAMDAARRTIQLTGTSAQVAAANGFAAQRRASVTNNSTTNDNRSYSSPVTVSIQATIREDADITKLAKEINRVQQRALRAGGNA